MTIGEHILNEVVRDTKDYYLKAPATLFSSGLIDFAVRYSGKKVLDLGCATGNYMVEMSKRGFDCVGVDINPAYVEIATKRSLEAHIVTGALPFPEKSFDTVLMFEVAEHLSDPLSVLAEAGRVARRNIIVTVPNCEGYDELKRSGLMFEHFLDRDHAHFFTEASMRELLSQLFTNFAIQRGDPIYALSVMNSSVQLLLRGLHKVRLIRPRYFFRLYAVIHLGG